MPSQRVYFSITPLNEQSTSMTAPRTLNGGFSPKNGNDKIRFAIGTQDRLLPTDEMYLTGQIVHLNSDGTPLAIDAAIANADYDDNNGVQLQKFANQNISNFAGIETMVSKIFLQSKKTSVNIAEHRNYPMYVAARKAWTNSEADFRISPAIRTSAGGLEAKNMNRHSIFMDNATSTASGAINTMSNINDPNYGHPFSFRLDTSILNNTQPLHLGQDYLGGLLVDIELNNQNGFYSDRFRSTGVNMVNCDNSGSYYLVKNLRLNGRFLVPTPADLQAYNPNFMLNDRFNLPNRVNSSVNASKYTPNVRAVRSIVNLFLNQGQENSRTGNQTNFRLPPGLQEYQQNKNNVRQPQDFVIEVQPNLLTTTKNSGAGSVDASAISPKAGMEGDAEVRNLYQRSVLNGELAGKTICGLHMANESLKADYDANGDANTGEGDLADANAMGIGLDYTHHAGIVSNYSGSADYDIIIKSGVESGNAVLPVSRRSVAQNQEGYIKNVAVFNSQTLVKQM